MPKIGFLPNRPRIVSLGVVERLGIAGAVGEEHAVGLVGEHLVGRGRAGQDRHAAAHVEQVPGDVPLHAVVQRHDVRRVGRPARMTSSRAAAPNGSAARSTRSALSGITSRTRSRPTRPGLALALATRLASSRSIGREHALHRPVDAKPADQRPGVDAFEADDVRACEIVVQIAVGAEVAHAAAVLADDEAGQMRLVAFDVLGVDAVVADLRVGHRDDLAAIARIGEDFLIAGHRGVEADLAVDLAVGAEGSAGKDRSVFQSKFCEFGHVYGA